jgi:hypothetical protein
MRERLALTVLPAVLTGIYYIYLPGAATLAKAQHAREGLAAAQAGAKAQAALVAAKDELEVVRLAMLQGRAKAAKLKDPLSGVPSGGDGDTQEFVSQTLAARGLKMTRTERLTDEKFDLLPAGIREQWRALSEQYKLAAPQIWRIEAEGSYGAMLAACRELSSGTRNVIPLSVTLSDGAKANVQSSGKRWTLLVWL